MSKIILPEEIRYAVYFERYIDDGNIGYYSESQPNYSWSLTEDISKAKKYKKINEAISRLNYPEDSVGKIVEVKINSIFDIKDLNKEEIKARFKRKPKKEKKNKIDYSEFY